MLYSQEETTSLADFLKKKPKLIWVAIILLTLAGFSFGIFGIYTLVSTNEQEIVTSSEANAQICEQKPDFDQITVYISGAVVKPGVYILQNGDRLVDVLALAGGIAKTADPVAVNKNFNLATRLSDSDQIYIPTRAEVEASLAVVTGASGSVAGATSGQTTSNTSGTQTNTQTTNSNPTQTGSTISVNSASQDQLMELSGIGEARSSKIIENRPYASLQELVTKGSLSQSLFDDLSLQLSL